MFLLGSMSSIITSYDKPNQAKPNGFDPIIL